MKVSEIDQAELTQAIEETLGVISDYLGLSMEYDYEIEKYQKAGDEGASYEREILKLVLKNIVDDNTRAQVEGTAGEGDNELEAGEVAEGNKLEDSYEAHDLDDDNSYNRKDEEVRSIESLLIGYRGQSLDRLQHIVSTALSQKFAQLVRVSLDISNYRGKRQDTLENIAHRAEQTVIETGMDLEMEPMSSADRRVVHQVLSDGGKVATSSIGEGRERRIVVKPLSNS
jgi:spoIIIJ-associated protein